MGSAFKGRREDRRLVTGRGRYVADVNLPGQLYAAFLRSDRAHAEIVSLNTEETSLHPGVVMVLTGEDTRAAGIKNPPPVLPYPGRGGERIKLPDRTVLATGRVCFIGQEIAMVVAESAVAAQDAVEKIAIEYRDLPAVIDAERAIEPGAPQVHPEVPGNVCFDYDYGDEAQVNAIFAGAAHVTKVKVDSQRVCGVPMEPKACLASYDAAQDYDFTWTSPYSRTKVHPGYPWDLLRTYRSEVTYVTVSRRRQATLANLLSCDLTRIHVIYNGVDSRRLLGLTAEGWQLANRLDLFESDLILLMPVRITHAKNIEFALRVVASLRNRGCRPKLILTGPPDPHDVQSMDYFHSLQDLRQALDINSEMRFIFESGPHPDQPHTIDEQVIGELFRLCDVMFMPSFREGFGMPVLEAGLTGIPVVSTNVPAAEEIGNGDITLFNTDDDPDKVAELILEVVENSPIHHLKRRVRQNYTWEAIFRDQIEPLLTK